MIQAFVALVFLAVFPNYAAGHNYAAIRNYAAFPNYAAKVFHINLCWECMTLPPSGSALPASTHCKAGKFVQSEDSKLVLSEDGIIPQWIPDDKETPPPPFARESWKTGKNKLVTSCTRTFLQKMLEWNKGKEKNYDVITMVEMANPGEEGFKYLGRAAATLPDLNGQQQVDPKIYEILTKNVLQGYSVFANVVSVNNIATQATYWNPESLGDLTMGLAFNTIAGDDRPGSALFFEKTKTLVLNIHGIHFRKWLIYGSPNQNIFGQASGTTIEDLGGVYGREASVKKFTTEKLQELYGDWLTAKMMEELRACKKKPNEKHAEIHGYCTGDLDFIEKTIPETMETINVFLESWKIIVAGDFNDETMELSKFSVFGREVSVKPEDRKRTCCSAGDKDFRNQVNGTLRVRHADREQAHPTDSGVKVHTKTNTDYLVKTCKYFGDADEQNAWFSEHQELNPMMLEGAEKVLGNGRKMESAYPFSSDMILGSANLQASPFPIVFPEGYAQKMSQGGRADYKQDPKMAQGVARWWDGLSMADIISQMYSDHMYSDGIVSDHDPIERTFEWQL